MLVRPGQGLNAGPNKKKGMLAYVKDAMEKEHPGLRMEDWTIKMIRNMREEILEQAKKDVSL